MAKQLHFYVNRREPLTIGSYIAEREYIIRCKNHKKTIIDTYQLALLIDCWDYIDDGWNVFVHIYNFDKNDDTVYEIKDKMITPSGKELKRGNNVLKMILGGAFGKINIR